MRLEPFFSDENFSSKAARMLRIFDPDVDLRIHAENFEQGTPDTEWMSVVASWVPKPALLSGDGRILRNKRERATLKSCDLTFVHLSPGWTKIAWTEFAWKIIKAWPGIKSQVERTRAATVFKVHPRSLRCEKIALLSQL